MADKRKDLPQEEQTGLDFSLTDVDEIELLFSMGDQLVGNENPLEADNKELDTSRVDNLVEETLRSLQQSQATEQFSRQQEETKKDSDSPKRRLRKARSAEQLEKKAPERPAGAAKQPEQADSGLHVKTDRLDEEDLVFEQEEPVKKEPQNAIETGQENLAVSGEKPRAEERDLPEANPLKAKGSNLLFGTGDVLKKFLSGIFHKNPVLFTALGLCPVLIAAQDAYSGVVLAVGCVGLLLWMALFSPFAYRFLPAVLRPPVFAVLSMGLFAGAYILFPEKVQETWPHTGIYLPLLTATSLVVYKATREKSEPLFPGMAAALGEGIGYAWVVIGVSIVRELIVSGTVFGRTVQLGFRVPAVLLPFAVLIALAFAGAVIQWVHNRFSSAK